MRLTPESFAHFAYRAGRAVYGSFAAERRFAAMRPFSKAMLKAKHRGSLAMTMSTFDAPRANSALTAPLRRLKSPKPPS